MSINDPPGGARDTSRRAPRSTSFVPFERSELERSITARFEKIVALHPERLAICGRITTLTYRELNRAANRVSRALLQRCGPARGNVGLLFDDESQAITAIIGVLKSGQAYVPLDRAFPRDRLRAILDDC